MQHARSIVSVPFLSLWTLDSGGLPSNPGHAPARHRAPELASSIVKNEKKATTDRSSRGDRTDLHSISRRCLSTKRRNRMD